jgi:RNase P/RNase MRP subunit POP5
VKGTRRHRYISFQITYKDETEQVTQQAFIGALRRSASERFSNNMQELGLWVIRFDGTTGILKCHYRQTERSKTLLHSLTTIGSTAVTITTHETSGTIKALLTRNKQHNRSSE